MLCKDWTISFSHWKWLNFLLCFRLQPSPSRVVHPSEMFLVDYRRFGTTYLYQLHVSRSAKVNGLGPWRGVDILSRNISNQIPAYLLYYTGRVKDRFLFLFLSIGRSAVLFFEDSQTECIFTILKKYFAVLMRRSLICLRHDWRNVSRKRNELHIAAVLNLWY